MSFLSEDKKIKYTGAYNLNGYLACEKCGSKSIKMTNHFDGRDFFGEGGHCVKCGNIIQIWHKRYGGSWKDSEVDND